MFEIDIAPSTTTALIIKYLEPKMTSIFEGQPLKTRPFPTRRMVIWVPGALCRPSFLGGGSQRSPEVVVFW